jgi:dihydrofolate reductase
MLLKTKTKSLPRKVILLMGLGLDGTGAEGWVPMMENKSEALEIHNDMWKILKSVDTFLLGRVCYQLWEKVWPPLANDPSSSDLEKKFSQFTDRVRKVVFSGKLKSVAWQNSELAAGDIQWEIARMKKLPGKNMAIVGGPGIAQAFSERDLIDEYYLWLHPAILGNGKPLLGILDKPRELKLTEAKIFKAGVVFLHYQRWQ